MARAHPKRVVTGLTIAVENEYCNYPAGKLADGGRLANFRHPALSESFAVLACDVVPPRVASGCAGALSGADARRPSGSDSPAHGLGVRGLFESTKRSDLTESGRTIVITVRMERVRASDGMRTKADIETLL